MSDHEFYEMQSVLAAAGQLSNSEAVELERHVDSCARCQECLAEIAEISRILFVEQNGTPAKRMAPRGMEERFLSRAAQSGIAIRRSALVLSGMPLGCVAALAVVLIVAISSGWRRPPVRTAERVAGSASNADWNRPLPALKGDRSIVATPSGHNQLPRNDRWKQRKALVNRAGDLRVTASTDYATERSLWPDGMERGQLAAASYNMPTPSFAHRGDAALFFHGREDQKPRERTFRLDPKLASLSFLEFPQSRNSELDTTLPTFGTATFHLSNNRIR